MVRVNRWSQPRKEKYILIEYIHHTGLIRYDEFDKFRWSFELHQASPEEEKDCLSWMAREGSFHPTAFGAKTKLPDPKRLTCFLMEKRPSVVSENVEDCPADRLSQASVVRLALRDQIDYEEFCRRGQKQSSAACAGMLETGFGATRHRPVD